MITSLEMFEKVMGFKLRHKWILTDTIVYVLADMGVYGNKMCGLTMMQELPRGKYTTPLVYVPVCDTVCYLHHNIWVYYSAAKNRRVCRNIRKVTHMSKVKWKAEQLTQEL